MSHSFTPAILIHLAAALAALGMGAVLFLRPKSSPSHRLLGRLWLALMVITAVSTYWIRTGGGFSWLHGFSIATLVALAYGLAMAVAGRPARHRAAMVGVYGGGLVIAGLFTLLPQRLLGQMLWAALGLA